MSARTSKLCCLLIVAAIALTFGRVATHEFVGGWDDGPLIYENPLINPPTTSGLVKIWQGPHARMYIPMVYTTWWTLTRVASVPDPQTGTLQPNPWVFHCANLLVHTLGALVVFAILRRIARNDARSDLAACAGALLFAIHPLQTEAVAWATGMKDLLCGLLALAALWQHIEASDRNSRVRHLLAVALFILSLLAKPAAVVVPFIAITIDILLLDRNWRKSLIALAPWLVVSLPFLILTRKFQPTPEIFAPPLWQRAVIALDALGFYVAKLACPLNLAYDYGLRPQVILHTTYWPITALVTIAIVLTRSRRAIACMLIFIAGVFPVLGLTPFVFQWVSTVADRYVYLSMLGPALAVAFVIARFPNRQAFTAIAAILLAFAALSFMQAGYWKDIETLSRHTLAINPNSPPANTAIGDALFRRGDYAHAADYFTRAVEHKNDLLTARDNLAVTFVHLGRTEDAIKLMKETLAMRQALPEPIRQPVQQDLERISILLRTVGRDSEADAYARKIPATRPAP